MGYSNGQLESEVKGGKGEKGDSGLPGIGFKLTDDGNFDIAEKRLTDVADSIGHVRYINIQTWLRGFQVKLLYLVLFLLYPSLSWELRYKKKIEKFAILTRKPRSHA